MQIPLEVIGLSKIYNNKDAVKDISFKVNKNEIIGILGPNGCGKTTTRITKTIKWQSVN